MCCWDPPTSGGPLLCTWATPMVRGYAPSGVLAPHLYSVGYAKVATLLLRIVRSPAVKGGKPPTPKGVALILRALPPSGFPHLPRSHVQASLKRGSAPEPRGRGKNAVVASSSLILLPPLRASFVGLWSCPASHGRFAPRSQLLRSFVPQDLQRRELGAKRPAKQVLE